MSLANGWITTSLNDIVKITTGKYDANHAKEDGNYHFFTCAMEPLRCDTFILDEEVLLLPGNGANVGQVFYFKGKFDAYQRTYILSNIKINPKFLYYQMLSEWDVVNKEKQYGSATNYIKLGNFLDYTLSLPPLNEQKRIAQKLDGLLGTVESIKTRLDNAPTIIKRFRQSILAAATSGRLTEEWREENGIVAEWKELTVNDIAKVGTGNTPLKSNISFYEDGDIPWLTSSVTGLPYVRVADKFVTQKAIDECRLKLYASGTLLVAMYGEGKTRGQVTELTFPASINQACAAIIVDEEKIEKPYLKMRLQENYAEIRMLAEGGNQPNLNLTKVRSITVPTPSKIEQKEIVSQVESLFALADTLEEKIEAAKKRVDKLTQSILAKAFRGELVEQDPNDESAEKLLERIKGEQEKVKPKKTRRKRAKKIDTSTKDLLTILSKEDDAISASELLNLSSYENNPDDMEEFLIQLQQLQVEKRIEVERRDYEDWIRFCVEGNI